MWHSLTENGKINYYDVEWPDGSVETDIPARLLEKVKDSEDLGEAHEAHGVDGHEEDLMVSERKRKKKSKKKKSKKSKRNKHKLYPYFYGLGHDLDDNYYEPGLEGGFSSGIHCPYQPTVWLGVLTVCKRLPPWYFSKLLRTLGLYTPGMYCPGSTYHYQRPFGFW